MMAGWNFYFFFNNVPISIQHRYESLGNVNVTNALTSASPRMEGIIPINIFPSRKYIYREAWSKGWGLLPLHTVWNNTESWSKNVF